MNDENTYLDFDEDLDDPQPGELEGIDPSDDSSGFKPYLGPNGTLEDPLKDPDEEEEINNDPEDDLITAFLKSRGVSNPEEMKFEGEDGEEEIVNFNDLSREEQMNILLNLGESSESSDNEIESELEQDELDLLNEIRNNDLSVKEYLDWYANQAIENYLNTNTEFQVDSLSDEELFLADLKDTLPDLTDEEALQILDQEKANENLFNKKVERLRNIYKDKEVQQRQIELAELQAQQEEEIAKAREQFQATLTDLDSIGEFNLEDEDKERIAEFLLGSDKAGNRYFNKALNDPSTLIKMAWFALYGEESLDDYSNYFKERIQEYSEANYKQGYEDALAGKAPKSKKVSKSANSTTSTSTQKTVVKKTTKKQNNNDSPSFIPLNTPSYMIDLD